MKPQNVLMVTSILFALVAVLHFVRALLGWTARFGPVQIPVSVSWVAVIVAGFLAYASWTAMWALKEED